MKPEDLLNEDFLKGSVALIRKGCIFNRESDFKKLAHRKF